jgi:3-dehydroquinate dehydratase/shikimate dehydrogenase
MALIVASILAEGREATLRAAAQAVMAGADWIELRLDRWPADADLNGLIEPIRVPVLVACRTPEDGGYFRGTQSERRELLSRALDAGAQGLDLEHWETWSPSLGRTGLRLLVRSFHSLTGVPRELPEIQDRLLQKQGTVAKIAVTAPDLADAAPVLDLLASTDQKERPTVAFAMGRAASVSRVLAAAMGAPLVFASAVAGQETAPGQIPVAQLAGLYRVRQLSSATAIYGLIGNPALQSLGPWLHNRAFRRLGLDAVYLPFETSRPETVLAMLPRRQLRGLSVTAPHKATMAQQCHRLSSEAAATGVVNTLVAEAHGMIVGHNTDVAGVVAALRRFGAPQVAAGERAGVVLGTGGAARAAAFALKQLGYAVTMLGRSLEPARAFAAHQGVQLGSLQSQRLADLQPAIVVQATPVGGRDRGDPGERLVPEWQCKPGTIVLDMVYQPAMTPLLVDVLSRGGIAISGTEMFLAQAAAQVELFTGETIPEADLRGFLAGTAVSE